MVGCGSIFFHAAENLDRPPQLPACAKPSRCLTGSRISSQVDLTGPTLKNINVSGGPHRFTGKKGYDAMHRAFARRDAKWDSPKTDSRQSR